MTTTVAPRAASCRRRMVCMLCCVMPALQRRKQRTSQIHLIPKCSFLNKKEDLDNRISRDRIKSTIDSAIEECSS
jgi:hypothetical protein